MFFLSKKFLCCQLFLLIRRSYKVKRSVLSQFFKTSVLFLPKYDSVMICYIGKCIGLQISLRWVYEQGVSFVAKSFNKERMKENLQIFDWCLTEEDSNKIDQLPQHKGTTFASILGPHDLILELDAEI